MKDFESKLDRKMKCIWVESAHIRLPEPLNVDDAWMRLEQRMEIEESKKIEAVSSKPSIIQSFLKPKLVWAIATTLVLVVLTPPVFNHFTTTTIITDRAQIKKVTLPDGSVISLNAESKISYKRNYGTRHRNIELFGEAYFDVKKGKIPFIVDFGPATVEVVGTKFNIRNRQDDIEVAVIQGTVKVSEKMNEQNTEAVLTKGQLIKIVDKTKIGQTKNFIFNEYPGWINNNLILRNSKLQTVCNEIERKFDVKIEFESANLGSITISGIIEASDLRTVLETLSVLAQRSYRFEKDTYIIF